MKNDGGSAFPWQWIDRDSTGEQVVRESHPGMSLRDWFAGQALASLVYLGESQEVDDFGPVPMALEAYRIADAMLAEREKGGKT
jgi:hypothetical protein